MMRRVVFILILCLTSLVVAAQNATSSPSSRYAYGELNDNVPATYRAMGSVGLGMRSNKVINPMQPASYTACDSMTFMFNIAGSLLYTNYSDSYGHQNKVNGNLEYVTLQFPIWRQWIACSFGITPYSASGYGFAMADSINSDYHYATAYAGSGGLTNVYGGLSFNICNWVAIGANAYYMFGDLTQSRTLAFTESLNSIIQADYLEVNSWRFRYGLQLFHTFGKHSFTLGGIFENKHAFDHSYFLQAESSTLDTVFTISNAFEMPMVFGGGLSYAYDNRLTVAFDYSCQEWEKTNYFNAIGAYLKTRHRFALGAEYRHNPLSRNYADRMLWRLGVNYTSPYVQNLEPNISASFGFGLPLKNVGTIINATFEYTHCGAAGNLNENAFRLIIDASIAEHWFFKRKL